MNRKPICDTAILTCADLTKTDIPYTKQMYETLKKHLLHDERFSGKDYFVESRYKGSEKLVRAEGITQVVEIGSGFTTHASSLSDVVTHYIELDLPENSSLKKIIQDEVNPLTHVKYIPGDIYQDESWKRISKSIKTNPVAIFAEGFMQYTNCSNREYLANQIKQILQTNGGIFFHEDSLTFHPESLR